MKPQAKTALFIVGSILLSVITALLIKKFMEKKKYIRPVGGSVTSKFGNRNNPISGVSEFHNGTDYSSAVGTPVIAPHEGLVENVYFGALGGNQIVIRHGDGYRTGYAHLDTVNVRMGDSVSQGDQIGTVGKTGQVTGPHLHFTVRNLNDQFIDPEIFLNSF